MEKLIELKPEEQAQVTGGFAPDAAEKLCNLAKNANESGGTVNFDANRLLKFLKNTQD